MQPDRIRVARLPSIALRSFCKTLLRQSGGGFPPINRELRKRTKADLIAMILVIAKEHAVVARELEDRLDIEKPVDRLVADVSSAIDRATDFDERMMNHNFDVDWQAYADVQNIPTTAAAKSSCVCRGCGNSR